MAFKGIVSRDFEVCFGIIWYIWSSYPLRSVFVFFKNFVSVSKFSILVSQCIGSLNCELIGTLTLSRASVIAPYWDPITGIKKGVFCGTKFADGYSRRPWDSAASPHLWFLLLAELSLISFVKTIENGMPLFPVLGLNLRLTHRVYHSTVLYSTKQYAETQKSKIRRENEIEQEK
jgi:hypothetical protein